MLKALFVSMLMLNALFAQVKHIYMDRNFLANNNLKIIDIRTKPEWLETGIIKGSYTITFFDEKGSYNIPKFLHELNAVVDKDEPFVLICRTGSRTRPVSKFLDKNGYKVINVLGGIVYAKSAGVKLVPYKN